MFDQNRSVRALVPDYRKWPGLCSRPRDWPRREQSVRRPDAFFESSSSAHRTIGYRFTIPPQFADRSPEQLAADVEALIRGTRNATIKASGDHAAYDLARKAVGSAPGGIRTSASRFGEIGVVTRACDEFRSENAEFSRKGPLPAQSIAYRLVPPDSTSSWQPRGNEDGMPLSAKAGGSLRRVC